VCGSPGLWANKYDQASITGTACTAVGGTANVSNLLFIWLGILSSKKQKMALPQNTPEQSSQNDTGYRSKICGCPYLHTRSCVGLHLQLFLGTWSIVFCTQHTHQYFEAGYYPTPSGINIWGTPTPTRVLICGRCGCIRSFAATLPLRVLVTFCQLPLELSTMSGESLEFWNRAYVIIKY